MMTSLTELMELLGPRDKRRMTRIKEQRSEQLGHSVAAKHASVPQQCIIGESGVRIPQHQAYRAAQQP
jgi:hypothetical protein